MSRVAGVEAGQRRLNGPQTTGREYRNLSEPVHAMRCDRDVTVGMRDGMELLADVHRPDSDGRFPVLIAASPYPRQIQDLGTPMGFIEAGASDFWVPRGYVHVIANLRGTGGSGGTFGFFDAQERRDLHDLVEWAAEQPWCDGRVGMIGISYFAMAQLEAAVERPAHLRAIFPVAVTADLYEAAMHHGLFSSSFVTPFLAMVGLTSARSDRFWRNRLIDAARDVLRAAPLHKKFATMNGESSVTLLRAALKLHHDPHPWDDLWRAMAVEHPLRDEWWDERNLLPLLDRVEVPTYLGCDWQNVPLHLPSTFRAMRALTGAPVVRVAMLGEFGLTWPWESLHIEALAWFDHWLKNRDTGILDGPAIRYWMPGADEWRTSDTWPPEGAEQREWSLRADGTLGDEQDSPGERSFMVLGAGLDRSRSSDADPPTQLAWTSEPLTEALDAAGDFEVELHAAATATDTAWVVTLQDLAPDDTAVDVTAGWLRASLRRTDPDADSARPLELPCREPKSVVPGLVTTYRIPLVTNARRFATGHRIRLVVTSDDQDRSTPAIMGFRHAPVGTSSRNTVHSSSRLVLSVAGQPDRHTPEAGVST
ncbi:putative acyl esterase [Streptomyces sp. SAI-135]|uniref:CocE/NonD family hydrolase n=1 Tax=Streptomyces sp. SAI-117 TaxID=2940546 RepID=UPI0024769D29|nr:CocE/NonD family hydrolase [Streptomyces sp. SAI-117]MDH6521969.1 putative acyl esterase [Streptomyces sp. SAI-090]MDH6573338.1 putative acyl esterase [Streptomyces sp. SAI-117]MDH6613929.1 putative acyl esterase [Streptomyces sp. SAI-135]